MTSLTAFPLFPKFAKELQSMIFKAAAEMEDRNIVEVKFTRTPIIRRKGPKHPWRPLWTYGCKPHNVSPLLSTTKESRKQYLKSKPDILQLNRGLPVVHFNAARDTIYFDVESAFNLWHYITRYRAPPAKIPTSNLQGFEAILVLGSYHPGILTVHNNGLADVRAPAERALANLERIRALGARGYHPGGWDPAAQPFWWRPLHRRLRRLLVQVIDEFEEARTFPGHGQTTLAQRDRIGDARDGVDGDVDHFFGQAPGMVGIPVHVG